MSHIPPDHKGLILICTPHNHLCGVNSGLDLQGQDHSAILFC